MGRYYGRIITGFTFPGREDDSLHSTMACITEAPGMMLPGGATIPAVLADRLRYAETAGGRAVAMAAEGLTPDRIMTPTASGQWITYPACHRRINQRSRAPGSCRRPSRY
jgi:hypothetical protein